MPNWIELLEKFEAENKSEQYVAVNMAIGFLIDVLGGIWCDKYILPRDKPDPWLLNASKAWVEANPAAPSNPRGVIYARRVIDLADSFYTMLNRKLHGFNLLRQRFQTRNDTRALYYEALIASMLLRNGLSVEVIEESGVKGSDFDLLVNVKGVSVSVEITELTNATLTATAVLNKLQHKRAQVPPTRPAVLCMIIPEIWMKNFSHSFLLMNQAFVRFVRRSKRFNAIILVWTGFRSVPNGIYLTGGLLPVYNNYPRWPIPDYSSFFLKKDRWGTSTFADSYVAAVRTARLRRRMERS
jgi:hypothetical protein